MNQNDIEGVNGADLGLSLSEDSLTKLQDGLDKLHSGDHIRFKATIQAMGDSQHLHHLHGWEVTKTEGHMDVDVKVMEQGRYKVSHKNN
jgi:Co/Zn/Cd efflux system component